MSPADAPVRPLSRGLAALTAVAVAGVGLVAAAVTPAAAADRTVALVGSLQSELGCADDWQPACAETELALTATAGVYSADFTVPAGTFEYKVAIDDSWDEAYGKDGGDANIPLVVAGPSSLRFTYDDTTHRIALTPLDLGGDYTPADDALVADPVRDPGADKQFYFVMTDRFADGDDANDTGGLTGDSLVTGFDPTNKGFYEGGDLAGLHDQLDYIEGLGTTAIWLTPSFKNRPVQGTRRGRVGRVPRVLDHRLHADRPAPGHQRGAGGADRRRPRARDRRLLRHHHQPHGRRHRLRRGPVRATSTRRRSPYTDAAGTVFDPATYAGTDTFPTTGPGDVLPVHAGDRPRGRGRQGPGLAERPDALPQPRELDLQRGVDDVRRLLRPGRPHDREPGGRGRLRGRLQPVGRPGRRRLPHRHRQARELRVLAEVHDRRARPRGRRSATTTSSCSARSTTPTRSSWRRTCATAT